MKSQIIEYSSPTKVRSVMCIGKYHSKAFENCLPMKVMKFLWTIWICLWSSCTQRGSYNAISRNYTGRFKFWDLTSKMLQILKSYLLNSELWSNLTLCCLSHESGMIVCNLEPKILQHQLSWQQLIKYQKFLHNAILVFLLVLYMSYSNCWIEGLSFVWPLDGWIQSVESSFSNWIDWVQCNDEKDRRWIKVEGRDLPKKLDNCILGNNWPSHLDQLGKSRGKNLSTISGLNGGIFTFILSLPSYFLYFFTFFTIACNLHLLVGWKLVIIWQSLSCWARQDFLGKKPGASNNRRCF